MIVVTLLSQKPSSITDSSLSEPGSMNVCLFWCYIRVLLDPETLLAPCQWPDHGAAEGIWYDDI